jgi:hypothetical protein
MRGSLQVKQTNVTGGIVGRLARAVCNEVCRSMLLIVTGSLSIGQKAKLFEDGATLFRTIQELVVVQQFPREGQRVRTGIVGRELLNQTKNDNNSERQFYSVSHRSDDQYTIALVENISVHTYRQPTE